MSNQLVKEEVKVAKRIPPGDKWEMLDTKIRFGTLTETLEHIFQFTGQHRFIMDAKKGYIYIETMVAKEIAPPKKYSLYGESD